MHLIFKVSVSTPKLKVESIRFILDHIATTQTNSQVIRDHSGDVKAIEKTINVQPRGRNKKHVKLRFGLHI